MRMDRMDSDFQDQQLDQQRRGQRKGHDGGVPLHAPHGGPRPGGYGGSPNDHGGVYRNHRPGQGMRQPSGGRGYKKRGSDASRSSGISVRSKSSSRSKRSRGHAKTGRKRVKREVIRSLHKNWDCSNKFIFSLCALYSIPTLWEVAVAVQNWTTPCDSGLQYWMAADAVVTFLYISASIYASYRMHWGIQADPELEGFLINNTRGNLTDEDFERLELKYKLLEKKATICPSACNFFPFLVSVVGLLLWQDAVSEDNAANCAANVETATLILSIFKSLAPAVTGLVYGCSFLCLMTGIGRQQELEEDIEMPAPPATQS